MQYKVIVIKAPNGLMGSQFEAAAEKLAEAVNEQIAAGWEPQGGVSIGETKPFKTPCLFQAMVRSR